MISHIELNDMLKELKGTKEIRIQAIEKREAFRYEGNGQSASIPHTVFYIIITAKKNGEIHMLKDQVAAISEYDTRRVNTTRKRASDVEQEYRDKCTGKGFKVLKGIYKDT